MSRSEVACITLLTAIAGLLLHISITMSQPFKIDRKQLAEFLEPRPLTLILQHPTTGAPPETVAVKPKDPPKPGEKRRAVSEYDGKR